MTGRGGAAAAAGTPAKASVMAAVTAASLGRALQTAAHKLTTPGTGTAAAAASSPNHPARGPAVGHASALAASQSNSGTSIGSVGSQSTHSTHSAHHHHPTTTTTASTTSTTAAGTHAHKLEKHAAYRLNDPSRALAAVAGNTDRTLFLAGTQSVRSESALHLVEFDEEANEVRSLHVLDHPAGIVWAISPCAAREGLVFTVASSVVDNANSEYTATLYALDGASGESIGERPAITSKLTLGPHEGAIRDVLWDGTGALDRVASLDDKCLRIWKLESGMSRAAATGDAIIIPATEKKGLARITRACWSPHSSNLIATANDLSIRGWDLRTQAQSFTIDNAHSVLVRDVDYNPNMANHLLSCGDDGIVRFWDVRSPRKSLKELRHHTHWVWRAQYNRFHDQLVLSAGSDARVCLEAVPSVSSVSIIQPQFKHDDPDDPPEERRPKERAKDGLIAAFDQHEDSVYSIAWSAADPWIFASVSYDGRLVVNVVPRDEKYRIIL